jgi:hypothetical protein
LSAEGFKINHPNLLGAYQIMTQEKTTSKQTVYQLKITLKGIRPPIWRRVQLDSKTKLPELHMIIQEAMGWDNYHMHSFTIAGSEYGQAGDDFDVRSENNIKLLDVVAGEKTKFFYTYDFGDDWEHEIIVEKELSAAPNAKYPLRVCLIIPRLTSCLY